jgi:hypothetical protein
MGEDQGQMTELERAYAAIDTLDEQLTAARRRVVELERILRVVRSAVVVHEPPVDPEQQVALVRGERLVGFDGDDDGVGFPVARPPIAS